MIDDRSENERNCFQLAVPGRDLIVGDPDGMGSLALTCQRALPEAQRYLSLFELPSVSKESRLLHKRDRPNWITLVVS